MYLENESRYLPMQVLPATHHKLHEAAHRHRYGPQHLFQMGRILGASKVTVRYQVTIPYEVRKTMKIREGQTLVFVEDNGQVVIRTEL